MDQPRPDQKPRSILWLVAVLNLAYFAIEGFAAWAIGSVALFADAGDFLEDATLNFLVLWALGRGTRLQAMMALGLAGVVAAPGLAALWIAYQKSLAPLAPDAGWLTVTGAGAFVVNVTCASLLSAIQAEGGGLIRATYLSARNDAIGNILIILVGLITLAWPSPWPDVALGLGLFALHSGAGLEVFRAARAELKTSQS